MENAGPAGLWRLQILVGLHVQPRAFSTWKTAPSRGRWNQSRERHWNQVVRSAADCAEECQVVACVISGDPPRVLSATVVKSLIAALPGVARIAKPPRGFVVRPRQQSSQLPRRMAPAA